MRGTRNLLLNCVGVAALAGGLGWASPALAQDVPEASDAEQTVPPVDQDAGAKKAD